MVTCYYEQPAFCVTYHCPRLPYLYGSVMPSPRICFEPPLNVASSISFVCASGEGREDVLDALRDFPQRRLLHFRLWLISGRITMRKCLRISVLQCLTFIALLCGRCILGRCWVIRVACSKNIYIKGEVRGSEVYINPHLLFLVEASSNLPLTLHHF